MIFPLLCVVGQQPRGGCFARPMSIEKRVEKRAIIPADFKRFLENLSNVSGQLAVGSGGAKGLAAGGLGRAG
jgi:hypothetical protein